MDKKSWLDFTFYLVLILLISFFMNVTSNLVIQFCIALIGAIIGSALHKKFVQPKL